MVSAKPSNPEATAVYRIKTGSSMYEVHVGWLLTLSMFTVTWVNVTVSVLRQQECVHLHTDVITRIYERHRGL